MNKDIIVWEMKDGSTKIKVDEVILNILKRKSSIDNYSSQYQKICGGKIIYKKEGDLS